MLTPDEINSMLTMADIPDNHRSSLVDKIEFWQHRLKSENPELYIQKPGKEAFLFSEKFLIIIRVSESDPRFSFTFCRLNIKSCELKMNGLNERGGEHPDIKDTHYIELTFNIGDRRFNFRPKKECVENLLRILTNKILPNLETIED